MSRTPVAISLGSNIGDRAAHLTFAIGELSRLLENIRVSRVIETAPEGVPDEQGPFLNAAAIGTTELGPRELLASLHAIERLDGRERPYRYAPRTLDLDLILYGTQVLKVEGLEVPHPRFRERRFVLAPLAEIAPDWQDPVTGSTISALLRSLPGAPA
ncbi:MAG TPA: 2-amino-4-hydroxy-6-hydroxymethyldihydropteridine diphosphokinase [Vicinamibacterales bacterium]|nr:2-amino-4-hydroxy-6-hydroxymethyldihydropteridine diphosphokinase [Vicinamibacterales bacterium]